MRSSETRARNGLTDSGRRGSKGLKLRIAKQLPALPAPTEQAPVQASPLYSSQLWQASGQLQQRLTCDRELYYPELAVSAPVLKQLPDDSAVEGHQGKRAKIAGGQYRRSSFRESASDGTPRSSAVDDRVQSNPIASSSSSQDLTQVQERRQSATTVDDIAWPLYVANKRRRSNRTRRSDWQQWCSVLQGMDVATPDRGVADAALQQFAGSESGAEALLQQQRVQLQQLLLRQHHICHTGEQQEDMQLDIQQQDVQQQDQAQPASCVHVQYASLKMQPPAPKTAGVEHVVVGGAAVVKSAAGDASPGHETSQGSEMTCMQESPRAVPLQLTSWPSTSMDSDCQGQAPDCDVMHKPGLVVAKATGVGVSAAATAAVVVASAGQRASGNNSTPNRPAQPSVVWSDYANVVMMLLQLHVCMQQLRSMEFAMVVWACQGCMLTWSLV